LLLLDEPMANLDGLQQQRLTEILRACGKTIIYASHQ